MKASALPATVAQCRATLNNGGQKTALMVLSMNKIRGTVLFLCRSTKGESTEITFRATDHVEEEDGRFILHTNQGAQFVIYPP